MEINPTKWGVLKKVVTLSDLLHQRPASGEVWVNFRADSFGVTELMLTVVRPSGYGVWINSPDHNGVRRDNLELAFIFQLEAK